MPYSNPLSTVKTVKKDIRQDFPLLANAEREGKRFIYFDNAATTHKPQAVIDAMVDFYTSHNANVGRGVYALAEQATRLYEGARDTVARFINAQDSAEIIFTAGTTDSINIVASSWAAAVVKPGDEILISELEHHSNLVPWQRLAQHKGARLRVIPVLPDGTLDMTQLDHLIHARTKIVAITHVSNALGTHNDLKPIIRAAHAMGAKVLVDAAQSAAHQRLDVQQLEADFLVFSGHKVMGPTGIGVLYVNKALHEQMSAYQVGGGMVYSVGFDTTTFLAVPHRLEAGTPPVAQAIGLAAALNYMSSAIDFEALRVHEAALCAQLIQGLLAIERVTVLGPVDQLAKKGHLVSFVIEGMHPHDIAAYLDHHGIAVRAGHHCAQPLANRLGIDSSVRVSFFAYNTAEQVALFIDLINDLVAV